MSRASRTSAIPGQRVGAGPGPVGECWAAPPAPRRLVSYWCVAGHVTELTFAAAAVAPATWDCRRCGAPAGLDPAHPPAPPGPYQSYKAPLEFVRDRRSEAELDAALTAALAGRPGCVADD